MTETKPTIYGVISDIHDDPDILIPALAEFKKHDVERLLVNGDIGEDKGDIEKTREHTARILDYLTKSNLDSYVQPGSHETLLGYGIVVKAYSDKHSNIHDTTKLENQKIENNGHTLAFLPGSDFLAGGQYQLANGKVPSGLYIPTGQGLHSLDNLEEYVVLCNQNKQELPLVKIQNINDLEELVTSPDNTIVVCHVPRKFYNSDMGVDMAHFGIVKEHFKAEFIQYDDGEVQAIISNGKNGKNITRPKNIVNKSKSEYTIDSILPLTNAKLLQDAGAPIQINIQNRGNDELRKLYEKIGITKSVSGHFHESSHRAHNSSCQPIPEDTYSNELFWNAGHGDDGEFGILTVDGDKVKYKNIKIKKSNLLLPK
jgi:predicted phosphodiesterase